MWTLLWHRVTSSPQAYQQLVFPTAQQSPWTPVRSNTIPWGQLLPRERQHTKCSCAIARQREFSLLFPWERWSERKINTTTPEAPAEALKSECNCNWSPSDAWHWAGGNLCATTCFAQIRVKTSQLPSFPQHNHHLYHPLHPAKTQHCWYRNSRLFTYLFTHILKKTISYSPNRLSLGNTKL